MLTLFVALATLQGPSTLEARVEAALAKMTLEEKIDLIGGQDGFYVGAMPKAGLPRLKMSDGPVGVRNDGLTTAYPAGFTLAATWNPELAHKFGTAIGRDARARGVHIWLGPGVNLARIMQNGRNFEYVGEDPYLAGRIATEIVKGVQSQGVAATIKHFAGNEHESDRNNDDSEIDERTLRELYLKPFEMVVRDAKPAALMTSYNLVNGVHASENSHLIMDVLKGEWGYRGIVMSDWVSVYSTEGPYRNGLDLEMPDGRYMNRRNILPLIANKALPTSFLDDKVRRLLRVSFEMEWDKRPQKDPAIPLDDPQSAAASIQVAREGTVLLKNKGNVLPFDKPKQRILVVGPNADAAVTGGGGSSYTQPFRSVSVRQALERLAPSGTTIDYTPGYANMDRAATETTFTPPTDSGAGGLPRPTTGLRVEYFANREFTGTPVLTSHDEHVNGVWGWGQSPTGVPTSFSARWKGRFTPTRSGEHTMVMRTDDGMRVFVDGKKVFDEWHDQAPTSYSVPIALTAGKPIDVVVEYYQGGGEGVAKFGILRSLDGMMERDLTRERVASADAVVACVGFSQNSEGEGFDRPWELPKEQEAMLRRLIGLNKKVVVVLNAGAGVATQTWIDGVAGLVHAGYPGGEGNLALAEILYGKTSPSGKLPTSFPATLAGTYYADAYPSVDRKMVYREGPFIGYRWFDANGAKPLYPFGYGQTYSTFALSAPKVSAGDTIRVSITMRNTGRIVAAETVQVYAQPPKGPAARAPRELRAFGKVALAPGESKVVTMTFAKGDLARYDAMRHAWIVDPGTYNLHIGTSSRDLPVTIPIAM